MEPATFEWDDAKDEVNRLKHGVSFYQAQQAFLDPNRVVAPDITHSISERRHFCIGRVGDGTMTVRFVIRGRRVRIIGAGYWRKGRRIYEEANNL